MTNIYNKLKTQYNLTDIEMALILKHLKDCFDFLEPLTKLFAMEMILVDSKKDSWEMAKILVACCLEIMEETKGM